MLHLTAENKKKAYEGNGFIGSTFKSIPFLFNYASMTYIFIMFNLLGEHSISITLSLLQGILALIIAAFSGDSRSIFLSNAKNYSALIRYRLIVLFLISVIFLECMILTRQYLSLLSFLLIIRRFLDWLEEILLLKSKNIRIGNLKYFIAQIIFLLPFPFIYSSLSGYLTIYFILWFFSTIYILFHEYIFLFSKLSLPKFFLDKVNIYPTKIKKQIYATTFVALGSFILRFSLVNYLDTKSAASIISAFSVGGFSGSLISNTFIPNLINDFKSSRIIERILVKYLILVIIITAFVFFKYEFEIDNYLNLNLKALVYSFLGGSFFLLANYYRAYLIQIKNVTTEKEDFLINIFLISCILFASLGINSHFEYLVLITSIFALFIYLFKRRLLLHEKYFLYFYFFLYLILTFSAIFLGFLGYYLIIIK